MSLRPERLAPLLLAAALCAAVPVGAQIPEPLTGNPADDRAPRWSPDGLRLAFETNREGNWDIWVIQADGADGYSLTDHPSDDRHPAWSPDGERIVFRSDRSGAPQLWILDLRTDSLRLLAELDGQEMHPAWSPDGERIAFTLRRDGAMELWSVAADGTDARPLFPGTERDLWPRWSPDGERIAFFSRRATGGEDAELHLLELATGEARRLTELPGDQFFPTWSPDGRRLLAATSRDRERSLRLFDLEGRPTLEYARGFYRATEPDWAPTGGRVAFAGRAVEGEGYEIYLVTVVP